MIKSIELKVGVKKIQMGKDGELNMREKFS